MITIATTTIKTTIMTVTMIVVTVKMAAAVDNLLCMKNGGTQKIPFKNFSATVG